MTACSPFAQVLDHELALAPPLVREHFAPPLGIQRYDGVMTRIWRAEGAPLDHGTLSLDRLLDADALS
ncbi:MAG: hypothetical protein EHM23_33165 [Acidobacteria bacterium]|nr:MAG: hypothetical protein EHM23_33165 [Acidobacteriota bacterium]